MGSGACADPRDYGAREGNPGAKPGHWSVNQKAIQAAINANSCVEIQGGDFATGDLYLRSNTVFRIAGGSRLLSSINNTRTAVVHIENATNVTLEGRGYLYGNAVRRFPEKQELSLIARRSETHRGIVCTRPSLRSSPRA